MICTIWRVTLIFFYFKELTSQKEKDFLTVLSMIKNKDPKIYEKDSNFYHEDGMVKDAYKQIWFSYLFLHFFLNSDLKLVFILK